MKEETTREAELKGYEDIVMMLRSEPERDYRDISGEVVAKILRRRVLVRRWISVSAAAAAMAIFVFLVPGVWNVDRGAMQPESSSPGDWLVSAQERDGSWDPARWGGSREYLPAVTGFAMMSLARHEQAAFDSAVAKAAQSLRGLQTVDGRFGETGDRMMFNQGIATVAMLKLYETGRFPELFTVIDGAVNYIRRSQNSSGGWGRGENNSAGIWLVDALGRASRLGWEDKGGNLRRGLRWLENSPESFSQEIAQASSLDDKRRRVERICDKWVSEKSLKRAGGKVFEASVAAR